MINVLYISHESDAVLGSTLSLANMLHAVRNEVRPLILLRAKGPAYDYLTGLGYECIVYPFKLNLAPKRLAWLKRIPRSLYDMWVNARSCVELEKIVTERNIQIIHSNSSVTLFGYQLAHHLAKNRIAAIPHVWHLREFINRDFGYQPFCGWERLRYFVNDSHAIIAITQAIHEHFVTDHGRPYFHVLNDAVRSMDDISVSTKEPYLLFCGQVIPAKGADVALQIFAQVKAAHPEYRLKYLGSVTDQYRQELLTLANQLGLAPTEIEFLGFQRDIRPTMQKATALLMCSRNEAQGRVTVEAMFYGTPVIGSNSGGTPEIIQHEVNGLLFDSIDQAVNHTLRIIEEPAFAPQLIKNAHQTAAERFSEEKYRDQLLKIYRSVLITSSNNAESPS